MAKIQGSETGTVFITICACNYLGFAVALGRSVKQHHPDARFVTWLIDGRGVDVLPDEIELRFADEALSGEEFDHLRLMYNVRELATAVKPHCLAEELRAGADQVIYLDPDILVFAPLSAMLAKIEKGAAGLMTPHLTSPLPRDGCIPDDLTILAAGVYNLGFLALTNCEESNAFLTWWGAWLRDTCFEDKSAGTFTDQKWVNFAPLFWPGFDILRDTSYNVAYWNLPQRELTQQSETWSVDDRPLTFFHFSGFDPEHPETLSKHQDRLSVSSESPLANLLKCYAGCLFAAGHQQWREVPFTEACFENGIALDDTCRAIYREALRTGVQFSQPPLGVGSGSLYAWITGSPRLSVPGTASARITRYLYHVYRSRSDVMRQYPSVFGRDADAFFEWLTRTGVREMNLNPALVAPGREFAVNEGDEETTRLSTGVNYLGYLRSELGLGEAARANIEALEAQGLPVSLVNVSQLTSSESNNWRRDRDVEALTGPNLNRVNVLHVNADQLFNVRDHVGAAFLEQRYNIGFWAWEAPEFPKQWWDRFSLLDEIWVGGSFMAESIAQAAPVPVVHIPHAVSVPDLKPDKSAFDLVPDEFHFLFMFDFHSTPARKNPEAAIEAFRAAFNPSEPVRLVIKSMNGGNRPEAFAQLRNQAQGLKVTFIDEAMDSERRYLLLASCDAFLSLHRAEGFGLCLAEAMAYAKPVIATGWSGNMDFMHTGNSFPVGFTLQELVESDPPYMAGTVWAEADLEDAACQMRAVVDDGVLAETKGRRAAKDINSGFSSDAIGKRIAARLEVIAQFGERQSIEKDTPRFHFLILSPRRVIQLVWRRLWRHTPTRWKPAVRRWAITVKRRLNYL